MQHDHDIPHAGIPASALAQVERAMRRLAGRGREGVLIVRHDAGTWDVSTLAEHDHQRVVDRETSSSTGTGR